MEDKMSLNPWKGLNFYTEGEILYGRNAEILSLSQYIFNNTQTVLYGRSGIGKSSILNAGIFPKARLAGMVPIGIRLNHDDKNNYLQQIKTAIAESGLTSKAVLPAVNGEDNETLWEFTHRHTFHDAEGEMRTPLLVFDQFEEIFTLQRNEIVKREFFKQLGNLLNDVKPTYIVEHENRNRQQQTEQHETKVVSSGAFKGLSLKLNIRRNDGEQQDAVRYLERPDYHIVFAMREDFLSSLELYAASIPVMKDNRFGLLPINEEQAADIIRLPRAGLVDDEVTKLIIQQVTGRSDFELDGSPEIEVDAAVLSLFLSRLYVKKPETEQRITAELVNTYSGHIIHDFYVDSIASNKDEIIRKETILLLENQLLTREGRRNNVSRSDLLDQGVLAKELDLLLDKRKLLRQFQHGNDIRIEFIHDILCPVVKERKEQRDMLEQQERERQRQEEEKQRLMAQQQKERRKMMLMLASAVAVVLLVLGWLVSDWFLYKKEFKTYYADFTRQNGWPVGVGDALTEHKAKELTTYYCLIKYGYKAQNNVEVLISPGRDIAPHHMRLPLVDTNDTTNIHAREFASLLRQTRRILFSKGEDNRFAKETAHDSNGNVLFTTNYYGEGMTHWATYTNANGSPMRISGEADRMRIVTDTLGMDVEYMFFDAQGVPCKNDAGDYGIAVQYDEKCRTTELKHLNAFRTATYTEKRTYSADGNYSVDYEQSPFPYTRVDVKLDVKGNVAERHFHYASKAHKPAFEAIDYSEEGLMLKRQWLDANHKPFKGELHETTLVTYSYLPGTKDLCGETRFNSQKDTLFAYQLLNTAEQRDSIVHDFVSGRFLHKRSLYNNGELAEVAFFSPDGSPAYEASEEYHKMVLKTEAGKNGGKVVYRTYYDEEGKLYEYDVTRSENHYDAMGNRTLYRTYDNNGNIIKSMAYEYENGVEKVRYAVGVNGTPIRCPQWETEGLCYYKLCSVRDFSDKLAQLYAVGENDMESLLYGAAEYSDELLNQRQIGCEWTFSTMKKTKPYLPGGTDVKLNYVHLLKKNGAADKAGLKDGDILVSGAMLPGGKVTVKRYNVQAKKTESVTLSLPKVQKLDVEVYPVYYSKKEYDALWK